MQIWAWTCQRTFFTSGVGGPGAALPAGDLTETDGLAVIFFPGEVGGLVVGVVSFTSSSLGVVGGSGSAPFCSSATPSSAASACSAAGTGSGSDGASTTSVASCSLSVVGASSGCAVSTGPDPSDRISSSWGVGGRSETSTSAMREVRKEGLCRKHSARVGSPQMGGCERTGSDEQLAASASTCDAANSERVTYYLSRPIYCSETHSLRLFSRPHDQRPD